MKSFTFSFILFFSISFFIVNVSLATNYYWNPAGTSRSFNTAGNWRKITCGGTVATGVPASGDTITYSNCSNKECHIDVNATVKMVIILGTYTDTLYQDNGKTFTFEKASLKGGIFMGGNSAISCTKDVTIDGTAFKSTSDVFTIAGDFTYKTGGFTHNSGKLVFNKGVSSTTTISSTSNSVTISLYKAEFGAPSHNTTFNVRNIDIQVNNDLTVTGDSSLFINTNSSSVIQAKGNVTSSYTNSTGGGTSTIEINGTGSQTLSDNSGTDAAGKLPNIKINKSAGTLSLSGSIVMGGSTELNYVAGTLSAGTSTIIFYYNNVIRNNSGGTMSLYNAQIIGSGGVDSVKGTVTITHNFVTTGSGNCNIKTTNGGSGTLEVQGDITWNNSATSTFGNVSFKCSRGNSQTFSGSIEPIFYNLEINKSAGSFTLQHALSVSNSLNLVSKNLVSDTTNLLTLKNGATVSNASYSSFVNGPIRKVGNSAFTFPVGKNNLYKPIAITAPSSSSDAFRAEYFDANQTLGTNKDTFSYISGCEYWQLKRTTGSSNVKVTLYWDTVTCNIYTLTTLRIGRWDGSKWASVGAITSSGTVSSGNIQSNSSLSSFTFFLLAKKSPLVYAHAGSDKIICLAIATQIGGSPSASGGLTPYSYEWSPALGLDDQTLANPNASLFSTHKYRLRVTDLDQSIAYDTVVIRVRKAPLVSAGKNYEIDLGGSVMIGGGPTAQAGTSPYTYSWGPSTGLSSLSIANPTASPSVSSTYQVTVTDSAGCSRNDTVGIIIMPVALDSLKYFALLAKDSISLSQTSNVSGKAGAQHISSTVLASGGNTTTVTSLIVSLDTACARIHRMSGTSISNVLTSVTLSGGGVYKITGSAILNGALTLKGDGKTLFVFDISDSLIVKGGSVIDLRGINSQQVIFRVGKDLLAYDTTYLKGIYLVLGNISAYDLNGMASFCCAKKISVHKIKYAHSFFEMLIDIEADFLSGPQYDHSITEDWLGFNGSNTWDIPTSNWGYVNGSYSSYGGSDFKIKLQDLHAGTIRFIGGSTGNYWKWEDGDFYKADEIPDFCQLTSTCSTIPANSPFCGYGVPSTFIALSSNPANKLEDFKTAVDLGKFTPIFMLNMLTDSLAPQINMLYHAQCIGLPIKYVELGNEFYLSGNPHFNLKYPTACDYAYDANYWAEKIHAAFPNVEIAAIGANYKKGAPRAAAWNKDLFLDGVNACPCIGTSPAFNTSINAITFHVYNDGGATPDILPSVFGEAYDQIAKIESGINGELNIPNDYGFDGWITEYGYNDNNLDPKYNATWVQGLYTAAMTLRFLETKEITHVNAQTIIGNGAGGAIFENNWEYTCIGNALKPICDALRFHDHVHKLTIPTSDLPGEYPELNGWYITGSKNLSDEVIIVNLSGIPHNINFSNNNIFTAPCVLEGYYVNQFDVTSIVVGDLPQILTGGTYSSLDAVVVSIQPYSVTRLFIKGTADGFTFASSDYACGSQPITVSSYFPNLTNPSTTLTIGSVSNIPKEVGFSILNPPSFGTNTISATGDQYSENLGTAIIQGVSTLNSSISMTGATPLCPTGGNYVTLTISNPGSGENNWTPSGGLYSNTSLTMSTESGTPVYAAPSQNTTYTLNVNDGQCYCTSIPSITVEVAPLADAGPDIFSCSITSDGNGIVWHDNPVLGTLDPISGFGITYSWATDGLSFSSTSIEKPSLLLPATTGDYTVTLTMTDNGCTSTDAANVKVVDCCSGNYGDVAFDPYFASFLPYWNTEDIASELDYLYPDDFCLCDGGVLRWGTDRTVIINGPLYVHSDFKFTGLGNLKFGPQASIIVDNGATLEFVDCKIEACSGQTQLWNGIYSASQGTTIKMFGSTSTSSHIYDARNAIFIKYDGNYDFESTTFDRNYNHLRLMESQYSLTDNQVDVRTIIDNKFLSSSVLINGDYCDTAIAVEYNSGVQVGDGAATGVLNTGKVLIDGAKQFGISGYKSNIDIYNSTIQNILNSGAGNAIKVKQDQPETYPYNDKVNIGNDGSDAQSPISILYSDNGIDASGMNSIIIGNEITSVNNGITISNTGVPLVNTNIVSTTIQTNTITTNSILDPSGAGINVTDEGYMDLTIGGENAADLLGNTINTNSIYGIYLSGFRKGLIQNNTINFPSTYSGLPNIFGIRAEGLLGGTDLYSNIIQIPSSSSVLTKSRGISFYNSINYELKCNTLDNAEYGLQFIGTCTSGDIYSIEGNNFNNHYNSFVLGENSTDVTTINNLGDASVTTTGNNFFVTATNKDLINVGNAVVSVIYNYSTGGGGDGYPPSNLGPGFSLTSNNTATAFSLCGFDPYYKSHLNDTAIEVPFLEIYPNPTVDQLIVNLHNLDDTKAYTFIVTDLSGRILIRKLIPASEDHELISCDQLVAGIYFVTLLQNTILVSNGKFIKVR